jgi:Flp pilus assembly protein TadB
MVSDGRVFIGLLVGGLIGLALVQILRGSNAAPRSRRRRPSPRAMVWLAGVGSGLILTALTGWPVLGVAGGFLIAQMVKGFREQREQRILLARRAELARFASGLRDACLAGHGMSDAVRIAAGNAGPAIRADMEALAAAVQKVGVGRAFGAYARVAPDPLFRVFAVMVGEADRQGSGALSGLLTKLAKQTSREVTANRESGAEQGGQRATAPIVAFIAIGLLLLIRIGSPAYVHAYSDAIGQAGMAAGLLPIGIGYLLMVRTGRAATRTLSWGDGR